MSQIHPVYATEMAAALDTIGHSRRDNRVRETIMDGGVGMSDMYELFVRGTGNRLPTTISTMYAPGLVMAGLVMDRLVDGVAAGDELYPGRPYPRLRPHAWFVGSTNLVPTEANVVGFVGSNEHGREVVLTTSPRNIVYATRAAIDRGVL